jgi:hypothetical protein
MKKAKTNYYLCGYCASAPRYADPDTAHALCRSDSCQCSLRNHRVNQEIRKYQMASCHAYEKKGR